MSSYIAGGSSLQTAADFTRGELVAIYKGDHWSRDEYGAMRKTPLPEALNLTMVITKCNDAIKELLNNCTNNVKREIREIPETTPISMQNETLNGFEKMAEYARELA
jgi:hypothetical protein